MVIRINSPLFLIGLIFLLLTVPCTAAVRSTINTLYTVAGTGGSTSGGGTGGVSTAMTMNAPRGVWEDSLGVVFVSEYNGNCIRKFSYPNGIVSAVAGFCGGANTYGGDNAPATSGLLYHPYCFGVDTSGVLYTADRDNNRIRMVSNTIIYTLSGSSTGSNTGDGGPATSATLFNPSGLWIDSVGQIYLTTTGTASFVVRKISSNASRQITLIAGIDVYTSLWTE